MTGGPPVLPAAIGLFGFELGFERPEWLWLWLAIPALALIARFGRRRLTRVRWALVLALRAALVAVLAAILAEPTLRRPVDDLAVLFVVDGSASLGPARQAEALAFVDSALSHQRKGDVAGVVVFGAEAMVDAQLQPDLSIGSLESRPNPNASDLAAGLRLGTALLPADRTRRIVLLTDGEQTRGDAAGQTLLAAGDDLDVSVVPLLGTDQPEALIEDLIAPGTVDEGASYEVRVVARSEREATGKLRLYRNDRYLGEMPVTLPADRSTVLSFRQDGAEAGLVRFRAQLEVDPSLDGAPENNVGIATVEVRGRPKVLLVERDEGQSRYLATVLRNVGFTVDETDAAGLPPTVSALRGYAAVFLSDVPSYAVAGATQDALEVFVRDLGGGLVMLGGDESFGVGGWYGSPVERALPVRMDIDDKARFPKLGMVLALDKSCSMGGEAGSKLGMAKEAAIRTAELLSDRDMLGLVTFDAASTWVSPLAPMEGRRDSVLGDIASIRSGGGTDLYPALEAAATGLAASDAALRHVVVLSDGMTAPGAFEDLVVRAHAEDGVTLTAIALGTDADQATMRQLSLWGGGNFYYVTDQHAIPAVFTREALLATRSFLIEEPITAALAMPSDLTRGLRAALPPLGGYVATQAKDRAVVAMVAQRSAGDAGHAGPDPLLAHWRYGLGRAVAFTSDAKARWGRDWLGTEGYTQLWTQVGRWVAGAASASGLGASAEIRDGELVLTVDALDPSGQFRNFLAGEARVVAPDNRVRQLPLHQVGPGRYEARMPVDQDGSWLAGVSLVDGDDPVGQMVVEAVQAYSPEFRRHEAGGALLDELARLGHGKVLTDPAEAFARTEVPRKVPRPLWPPLVPLAAALLLADVAGRRLAGFGQRGAPVAEAARVVGAPVARNPRWVGVQPSAPASAADGTDGPDEVTADPPPAEPGPGATTGAPPVAEDSYAGQLLAARRAARKKIDDRKR